MIIRKREPGGNPDSGGIRLDILLLWVAAAWLVVSAYDLLNESASLAALSMGMALFAAVGACVKRARQKSAGRRWRAARNL